MKRRWEFISVSTLLWLVMLALALISVCRQLQNPRDMSWFLGISPARWLLLTPMVIGILLFLYKFLLPSKYDRLRGQINGFIYSSQRRFLYFIVVLVILATGANALFLLRIFSKGVMAVYALQIRPTVDFLNCTNLLLVIGLLANARKAFALPLLSKWLRKFFHKNIVFFVFLPYSAVFLISVVMVIFQGNLTATQLPALRLYLTLAALPLVWFFVGDKSRIDREIVAVIEQIRKRIREALPLLVVFVIACLTIYYLFASFQIPAFHNRIGSFAENIPFKLFVPNEPPFYVAALNLLYRFIPLEFVVPTFTAPILILLFVLFVVYFKKRGKLSGMLAFLLVFSSVWALTYLIGANMEFHVGVTGLTGVMLFYHRKYQTGSLVLILGGLLKISSIIFIALAGLIALYRLIRRELKMRDLNPSLVLLGVLFIAMNYVQIFRYIFEIRGGPRPGYLLPVSGILITSIQGMFRYLYLLHPVLLIIACMAFILLFARKIRKQVLPILFLFCLLFVLRNIINLYANYYSMFFLPFLGFLALQLIHFLHELFPKQIVLLVFVVIAGVGLGWSMTWPVVNVQVTSALSSNILDVTKLIAQVSPRNTQIIGLHISLKPYLVRYGREDFIYLGPRTKGEALSLISENDGCMVWVSKRDDLGISQTDLEAYGFSSSISSRDRVLTFYDKTNFWQLLYRSCD